MTPQTRRAERPRSEPRASGVRPGWPTLANALTLLRLALAPGFVAAILADATGIAASILALAVATDVADGRLARRRAEASALGGALDHAVDAAFVTAGTAALAVRGALPTALPLLIAAAFLQYALDSRTPEGALRTSRLGRWNGIAYYAIVAVPLARDALGIGWPNASLVRALGWLLVATTVLSMGARLRLARRSRRAPGSPGAGRGGRSPR
jgi:phosphatidylglycerophosphate synthase